MTAVVALGWPAVAPILAHLRRHNKAPGMWGPALAEITSENPVRRTSAGNLRKIANDWLRWGKERGIY